MIQMSEKKRQEVSRCAEAASRRVEDWGYRKSEKASGTIAIGRALGVDPCASGVSAVRSW